MSIEIMNMCWSLDLGHSAAKFVLVSLADNSNNTGNCYPSIPYIAKRTSLSERSVHRAIARLEELNLVKKTQRRTQENRCKSNFYQINIAEIRERLGVTQCQDGGDTLTGGRVTDCQGEGDTVSGKPPENHHNESKNRKTSFFMEKLISLGVDKKLAEDWMKVRKKKKAVDSETSWNGFIKQVELSNIPLNDIVRECAERDWKGFKAEWIKKDLPSPTDDFITKHTDRDWRDGV